MKTNREEYVKKTQKPYQGEIIKSANPQSDRQRCSLAQAANDYDLQPILAHIAKGVTRRPWISSKNFIEAFAENQTKL